MVVELQPGLLPVIGGDLRVPVAKGGTVRYANLDYAASAPALESVARKVTDFLPFYASVHRGTGYASQVSTNAYEGARGTVADFVGARPDDTVIFTRNTTDSFNLLASIVDGETVVIDIEHHANLLPWLNRGATLLPSGDRIESLLDTLGEHLRTTRTTLVTITGASNVTGERLPLRRLADLAHRHGARLAVDGAQLVPHRRVDMVADDIDYLAFSGHKLYAPYGAGVLVGRADWFDAGRAYLLGGGAVKSVTRESTEWKSGAERHEAGSPNVLGAVAIAAAIEAITRLDENEWVGHETALRNRLADGLAAIDGVRIHRIFADSTDPVGVVGFSIPGISSRRAAFSLSAEWGIGVRDGKFCAHPLLERFGGPSVRASLGIGSSEPDVDRLLEAVAELVANPARPRFELLDGEWHTIDR